MSTLTIATKKVTRTRKAKLKIQPAAIQRPPEDALYCKNYSNLFAANLAKRNNKKTKV